ncbi:hypothetical protein [Swingsia samuiensis]|uniref:Auto-transporter adhesin head GIN domain-containing protein n=1 Tax=Swingsia samuiensis TaxID=1293412 RepID=A0A4Y6UJK8_9PROT|nr:hypothetical protein [Swingsia samuiensis]QDH16828.1 hypothetical protein E3D00_04035 [Swingsia samuiensis]
MLLRSMTIALKSLFLASVAVCSLSVNAQAARVSMSGEDLDLSIPCTGQVKITVDPSMKDGATLDSTNSAQLIMRTGKEDDESRISITTKSCSPAGKVSISVSPNTGVSIHDSHDTHFVIVGKLASLEASLDSSSLDVSNTQSLDLSMHGSSSAHVGSVERAAQIVASGTSQFTADSAQLAALSAQLTNNASLSIAQGNIDALTIVTNDAASATILGNASVATVTANGTGTVNIERVAGPVVRTGSGTVHVGAPNGVVYRPTPPTPPAPSQSSPVPPPPNTPQPNMPAIVTPPPSPPVAQQPTTLPHPPIANSLTTPAINPPMATPPSPSIATPSVSAENKETKTTH